jgi:hypothetical protein
MQLEITAGQSTESDRCAVMREKNLPTTGHATSYLERSTRNVAIRDANG